MRKNKKIFGLIACSAVLAGAVSLGAANVNVAPASAEGASVTFEMAQSASVKYGNEAAIRFAATVSKSYLDTLGTTVKLVSSIDKMGNTDAGEAKTREWIVKGEGSTYVSGYDTNTYYHSITFTDAEIAAQIKKAAAVDLTATMWLESDGVKVAGSEQTVTRSMRSVANAIYDQVDSEKQTELGKYVGTRTTATEDTQAFAEVTVGEKATTISKLVLPEDFAGYTDVYAGMNVAGRVDTTTSSTATINSVKTLGSSETLTLFDANNNVYNVPVMYVTDAIETKEEFAKLKATQGTIISGYYALAKDIGAEDDYVIMANNSLNATPSTFKATLDGCGHSVYVQVPRRALFGASGVGATIKNIGIYVMDFFTGSVALNDRAILFQYGGDNIATSTDVGTVVVENVYIEVDTNDNLSYLTLTGSQEVKAYKFKDVILNVGNGELEVPVVNKAHNSMIFRYFTENYPGYNDTYQTFENVNFITSRKLISVSSNNVVYFAQNDKTARDNFLGTDDTTNYKSYGLDSGSFRSGLFGMYGWTGTGDTAEEMDRRVLFRYDSMSAMAGQLQKVGDWTVATGKAVWKGEIPAVTPENYATTVKFSAAEGELPLEEIFGGEVTVTEAWNGETQLTVQNNKILGLKVSDTEFTNTIITVYTATKAYNIPVQACKKWISTPDDFKALKVNNETTTGYYALANDIGAKNAYITMQRADNAIFAAVLDGCGHSVYTAVPLGGIFNASGETATIKNMGIYVMDFVEANAGTNNRAILFRNRGVEVNPAQVVVENIYVEVVNVNNDDLSYIALTGSEYSSNYQIKDVIFNIGDVPVVNKANNSLIFRYFNPSNPGWNVNAPVLENVNVITTREEIGVNSGNKIWFAQNDKAARDAFVANNYTNDVITTTGSFHYGNGMYGWQVNNDGSITEMNMRVLFRYNTAKAMFDDGVECVGNWAVAADGTITWTDAVPLGN